MFDIIFEVSFQYNEYIQENVESFQILEPYFFQFDFHNLNIIFEDYRFFNIKDIKDILSENNIDKSIIDKINEKYITFNDYLTLNAYDKKFITIKRKEKRLKNIPKKKMGRRKYINDNIQNYPDVDNQTMNDKNRSDNIIKKIKGYYLHYLIIYCNIFINKNKKNIKREIKLQNLNYKEYINNLKKDINIKMLNKKLKEILSYKINARCKLGIYPDYNKKIISNISVKEANNEKINNFFEMTFAQWINIFTLKNNIEDNIEFKGLESILKKIINDFKDNDAYLTRFVLYLYNYQRYFECKKGRNGKTIKNKFK